MDSLELDHGIGESPESLSDTFLGPLLDLASVSLELAQTDHLVLELCRVHSVPSLVEERQPLLLKNLLSLAFGPLRSYSSRRFSASSSCSSAPLR